MDEYRNFTMTEMKNFIDEHQSKGVPNELMALAFMQWSIAMFYNFHSGKEKWDTGYITIINDMMESFKATKDQL